MKTGARTLFAVSLGISAVLLASNSVRAAIVCDEDGDCWHTRTVYTFPPAAGVVVHPDDWRWEGEKYRWREHEGRGYWRGGNWVEF